MDIIKGRKFVESGYCTKVHFPTPKAGYINLSAEGFQRVLAWWWKKLWKINIPPKTRLLCGVCWKTRSLLGKTCKKDVSRVWDGVLCVKLKESL